MKNVKPGEYGDFYEQFKGDIWITEQNAEYQQGMNIAKIKDDKFQVLAYVVRKGNAVEYNTGKRVKIEEAVWDALQSIGWSEEYCKELFGNVS